MSQESEFSTVLMMTDQEYPQLVRTQLAKV